MSDRPRGLGRGLGALIPGAGRSADAPGIVRHDDDSSPRPAGDVTARHAPSGASTASPPSGKALVAAHGAAALEPITSETTPPTTEPEGGPDREDSEGEDAQRGSAASYAELPADWIVPNPRQPRQVFDEDALAELVDSIGAVGLLQPVVVRPVGTDRYELVMGERRWRAAQQAGLRVIPAIVRTTADDDLLRDALLENLHRSELNALEEAAAYDQLLQDFACTHEQLSQRLGRSRPHISNTLRLLKLPAVVQRRVAAGVLSAGHARALLAVADPALQERLAQRVVAEALSVRALEEIVALGEGEPLPRTRTRPKAPVSPRLGEISERLSDRFDTRVKVDLGRRKGRIVMEFATLDDLERLLAMLETRTETDGLDELATDGGTART